PTQLLPVHLDVQLTRRDCGAQIVGPQWLPGAGVPDDHVATAVLAGWDDALKVDVLQRVILDVDSHPAHGGVKGGSLWHRPADQHAVDLEPQVVVQPARPVALYDEPARPSR